jgi:hypothetical protein
MYLEVVSSGVLAAVNRKFTILMDVISCCLVGRYKYFERICLPDYRASFTVKPLFNELLGD